MASKSRSQLLVSNSVSAEHPYCNFKSASYKAKKGDDFEMSPAIKRDLLEFGPVLGCAQNCRSSQTTNYSTNQFASCLLEAVAVALKDLANIDKPQA